MTCDRSSTDYFHSHQKVPLSSARSAQMLVSDFMAGPICEPLVSCDSSVGDKEEQKHICNTKIFPGFSRKIRNVRQRESLTLMAVDIQGRNRDTLV